MADFLLTRHEHGRGNVGPVDRWRASTAWRTDLVTGRLDCGPWALHWSAGPRAPVSTWQCNGFAGLILGDPVDGARGRVDAESMVTRVRTQSDSRDLALDGYFTAIVLSDDRAVVLGDLLGLYPIWRGDGSDFVAASSALPVSGQRPDPRGLAGILAYHGTVGGRSIVPGVTRVAAGHVLVASRSGVTVEDRAFTWPLEESLASASVEEQDEILHGALESALRVQLPESGPVGLLLTGGRDSRTLAGLLHRLGRDTKARTIANAGDHEAVLARQVANRLGIEHTIRPLSPDAFEVGVDRHLSIDHLSSGISHAFWRGASGGLMDLPVHTVVGHLYDVIVGGMMRVSGQREFGMEMPWEIARPLERRSGVAAEILAALIDPELREACSWADTEMRDAYLAAPATQRLWRWSIAHGGRFYIGMVLQAIAHETWPIVPVLDRALVDVAARLYSPPFSNRLSQDRMLRDRYPELANIPHTFENAEARTALNPTRLRRVWNRIRPPTQRPGPVSWQGDPRFVWRNTDFHNPGWTGIRQAAEPHRAHLHALFEATILDEYLPPPNGRLTRLDFASHQGPKLLTALALWLERHGH